MNTSSFGDYDFSVLRELRRQADASLEKVAQETGVSVSTLTRIETNQNLPNLTSLKALSTFFGMSPAHLLDLASTTFVEQAEETLASLGRVHRRGVTLPDISIVLGTAAANDFTQKPHRHEGCYQIQWVTRGRMVSRVQGHDHELRAGQAIKFDASFEHVSHFLEDTEYIVVLVPKRTR